MLIIIYQDVSLGKNMNILGHIIYCQSSIDYSSDNFYHSVGKKLIIICYEMNVEMPKAKQNNK